MSEKAEMPAALVTGCSSGFGEAVALGLVEAGYQVAATMRNPASAPQSLKTLANETPEQFVIAALDVTSAEMRQRAVEDTYARFGRLDLLVNNAGITARGSFEDTPEELWRRIFETNLHGPLDLIRQVLPLMRAQGGGRIVNVTSVAALLKTPFLSAYCASKHALDAATAALDVETRGFGVRAASVMPGPFKTQLPTNSLDRAASAPYADIAATFSATFDAMEANAPDDVSPVVKAVLEAASAEDPHIRYPVGLEKNPLLPAILQALEPLPKIGLKLTGQV